MADNVGYTPGSGATIKTDQGGSTGAHMQVVKLAESVDGGENAIPATVANGLAVDVTRVQGAVAVTGTVTAQDGGGALSVDDNGASLTVDDGGGSLTVDGGVTAAQGAPAAAANAWPVKVSDGTDTVGISSVAGAKALKVDVVQDSSSPAKVDRSAFAEAADKVIPIGGVVNDTPAADPAEDQAAALRMTPKRSLHVNLRSAAGTEIGTAAAPVRTDPTGTTPQPVSGTVTANQGTTPWSENVAQVGGAAVATAAAGVQKVGIVDGAGAAFSATNPLPAQVTNARTPVRNYLNGVAGNGQVLWTPAGGKRFVIESILISATATGDLFIYDSTNTPANSIFVGHPPAGGNPFQIVFPNGHPSSAINNVLRCDIGAAGACYITVFGYEV